jgi:hypothetical protein
MYYDILAGICGGMRGKRGGRRTRKRGDEEEL